MTEGEQEDRKVEVSLNRLRRIERWLREVTDHRAQAAYRDVEAMVATAERQK